MTDAPAYNSSHQPEKKAMQRPTQQPAPWMARIFRTIDIVSWVVFVLWLWLPKGTHWIGVLLDLVLLWIVVRSFLVVGFVQKKSRLTQDQGAGSNGEP